ncbi:MAG: DOMON-like domain-containing protein [Hyphomonadaceae bacterium]
MRHTLRLHPDSRCDSVRAVQVDALRRPGSILRLDYVASGRIADIIVPQPVTPHRADKLWEHTCFEVFLRRPGETGYVEFNFSPAGTWAAYRFASQRRGMSNLEEFHDMPMMADVGINSLGLGLTLDLGALPDLAGDGPWSVGISTIIEESNGRKSFWALAHPQGKADFHHPDSFALELPPVDAT